MKKYLLFAAIAFMAFACSKNDGMNQKKAEDTVKSYVKKKIADSDSYESIAFGKLDSIKLEDSKIYKEYRIERSRLDASIASLKQRMQALEDAGVNKSERLYTDLEERLDEEKDKLEKINERFRKMEEKNKEYVYAIDHKFKARKSQENVIMTYDEIFFIDKDNNVIEDILFFD